MDAGLRLTFLVAATALLILPGPDWAFMLAAGVRRSGIAPPMIGERLWGVWASGH